MEFEQAIRELSNAFNISLEEAAYRLDKAIKETIKEDIKEAEDKCDFMLKPNEKK